MPETIPDPLARATVTVPEAGRILGIGRDAAYRAANNGQIPVIRLGRRMVVSRTALQQLLDSPETTPPPPRSTGDRDDAA